VSITAAPALSLSIVIDGVGSVSALAQEPAAANTALAAFVLAHGAGAGMTHPFMQRLAEGLAARRIATLRFQFPYMEQGSKRTDPPPVAQAAVRAAVAAAHARWPGLPLFAGGKSFGARMSSRAQAAAPMPGVRGLVFVGFPLHPAGKPGMERAEHLSRVSCPMLFLQGTRDELTTSELMRALHERLGALAQLEWLEGADHSFHVRAMDVNAGCRDDAATFEALLDTTTRWMAARCQALPAKAP
jgi:hypothetical protein